ncbi:MAG: Chromosome partition protein Smc [Betaproteobacteria bacterium ADurb.Bin341]|nr:MAG: Chromosome partition protein Smc [Betaproteobacteria bacterium ADurb.Bin341]
MRQAGLWAARRKGRPHRRRRPRRASFGELVQMDTSSHDWLEGRGPACVLITMIDDATGRKLARFFQTDSTATNMALIKAWAQRHGRPRALYTDWASHFRQVAVAGWKQGPTQIERALKELDIELICAHSPQAKGRVERSHQTDQDRLIKEMRLLGIATIEAANRFLEEIYLPRLEQKFAIEPASAVDAHRPVKGYDLDAILSVQEARRYVADRQQKVHALQMEVSRLTQAALHYQEQKERLSEQLSDLAQEEEGERERELAADEKIAEVREGLSRIQVLVTGARGRLEETERAVRAEREKHSDLDRAVREAQFSLRECEGKLQDNEEQLVMAQRQLERIEAERGQCAGEVGAMPPDEMEGALQQALELRDVREKALAACRDALEEATASLRMLEEQRLRIEQGLEPLRERIGELKLKEQAAALNAEQLATQLLEAGADEAALLPELGSARPTALQNEINRLQGAILELGAVNLAALQELEAAGERKGFLDAQAADLTEALETLESAIRRIDRETRELLKSTFDAVNGHFGQLFPELFGGGRAELVMTGEEILDAGVQVIAQPPGKKNASIQLLSGGEKALTAIALVFAMFQLNPAPFCLLDEVDSPLDDSNTDRFCAMVKKMSPQTQFLFISHNKIAMEMAEQLVGVTMQEAGVSRVVEVDMEEALKMRDAA